MHTSINGFPAIYRIARPCEGGHSEKFHPWNFSNRKAKNAIFALLHFSKGYLFEKCAAYPYTAGHFE